MADALRDFFQTTFEEKLVKFADIQCIDVLRELLMQLFFRSAAD